MLLPWFEGNNWLSEKDEHGTRSFSFVGNLPEDAEVDAQAQSALFWNLQHLQIVTRCRKILDGELQKTPELHREFVKLLTSEEQLTSLQERLGKKAFIDIIWAAIAILLAPPINPLTQELEDSITYNANDLSTLSISLDKLSRCHNYNMDAESFIAHTAPKLLQRVESESSLRVAAFRCLIGVCDPNTSAFMRSWIKEYGLAHTLTQELINIAPRIARLISLTHAVSDAKVIQNFANPDGSYLFPHPEFIDEEISKREDPQIEEAWSSLQNDFEDNKNSEISLIDVSQWIPEILIQPLQQQPRWLQNYLDWDFLAAALIPVLEAKPDSEIDLDLISLLREQVLFALFQERATVYVENKAEQEEDEDSSLETQLYSAQSKIIDTIVKSTSSEVATRINLILQVLKNVDLVDCIVLGHVVDSLSYCIVESNSSDIIDHSFRNYTACTFGEYLFDLRNQPESNLQLFGRVRDIWEKLIDLLWQWHQENVEYATQADQWLMEFLERFQEVLIPDWWLRIKLYRIGKSTNYRYFRRLLFKMLIQNQELLPSSRNDESELLVQVFAELWDSDRSWIIDRQIRLSGLQTSLGQLQEIDALGARRLADQIANSLAHGSD